MSNNLVPLFSRRRAGTAPASSRWRESLRDLGDMLSGIYQDLRGDLAGSVADLKRSLRLDLRKLAPKRND